MPVKAAQIVFLVNAAIWLLIGLVSLTRILTGPGQSMTAWVIGLLMFGNTALMLIAGLGLGRQKRIPFYFASVS